MKSGLFFILCGTTLLANAESFERKMIDGHHAFYCQTEGFNSKHCDNQATYRSVTVLEKEHRNYLLSQGKTTKEVDELLSVERMNQNGFVQDALAEVCSPADIDVILKLHQEKAEAMDGVEGVAKIMQSKLSDGCFQPFNALMRKAVAAEKELADKDL